MNNVRYVVITVNDIIDNMIEESVNTPGTFRTCNTNTNAILKFNTPYPNTMNGYIKYNHNEICEYLIINAADWET